MPINVPAEQNDGLFLHQLGTGEEGVGQGSGDAGLILEAPSEPRRSGEAFALGGTCWAGPGAVGKAGRRKWGCAGTSFSASALPPSHLRSCMGCRFLRGLLSLLLPPPPLRVRHRVHSLECAQPSKRPRCSLMAPPRIGTHNGTFHCDEALACALLRLLPEYQVRCAWGRPSPPTFPDSPRNLALTPYPRNSWLLLTPGVPYRMQRLCGPGTPKNWLLATSW